MFTGGFTIAGDCDTQVRLDFDDGVRIIFRAGPFDHRSQSIIVNPFYQVVASIVTVTLENGQNLA